MYARRTVPYVWTAALAALLLLSGSVLGSLWAQEQKPIHRLEGTVVSKADGQPIAGAKVVLASVETGSLLLGPRGELSGSGDEETVLFFFSKRNGKSYCEATTGADGRFTLERFRDPGSRYVIAAAHAERGVAVMPVIPGEHAGKSLRIDIEPAAFLEVTGGLITYNPLAAEKKEIETYATIRLVGPLGRGPGPADSELPNTVWINAWDFSEDGWDGTARAGERVGPLPPGWRYRVTSSAFGPGLAYSPIIFECEVALAAGSVARVEMPHGGTRFAGRVSGSDGAPLTGVNVLLRSKANAGFVLGTITDTDGRYAIASAPAGEHDVELVRHAARTGPG